MLNCCKMARTRYDTSTDLSLVRMRDRDMDSGGSQGEDPLADIASYMPPAYTQKGRDEPARLHDDTISGCANASQTKNSSTRIDDRDVDSGGNQGEDPLVDIASHMPPAST